MKKIGELKTSNIYFCIYYEENAKTNPFRIYRKFWNQGWKKRLIVKYGDLFSVTNFLNDYVGDHNQE